MPVYEFRKRRTSRRKNIFTLFGWRRYSIRLVILGLLAVAAYAGYDVPGREVGGNAYAVDGDTIVIQGRHIRLYGIDAPEFNQTCKKNGRTYACGREAAAALASKIRNKQVTCEEKDIDKYQRIVAVCSVDGIDINKWMVAEGHALAYQHYSMRYVFDEMKARNSDRGIWAGEFQKPWDYRYNSTFKNND